VESRRAELERDHGDSELLSGLRRVVVAQVAVQVLLYSLAFRYVMRLTEIAQVCSLKFLTRAAWSL
jgi:hypothetical protein